VFSSRINNAISRFDIFIRKYGILISLPTQTSSSGQEWSPINFPAEKKLRNLHGRASAIVPSPVRRCSRESRLMPSGAAISILRSFDRLGSMGCLAFASVHIHKSCRLSKRGIGRSSTSINDRKILLCARAFLQRGKGGQELIDPRRRR